MIKNLVIIVLSILLYFSNSSKEYPKSKTNIATLKQL